MDTIMIARHLGELREARIAWGKGRTEFYAGYDVALRRLLFEAAAALMNPREIATHLAVTPKAVRSRMRDLGLDSRSKTVLSEMASEALTNNAELLGIDPSEMDLMSPLAYLPMGKEMADRLRRESIPSVDETEVSGNLTAEEREAITDAVAVFGPTNRDLFTLVEMIIANRTRA